VSQALARGADGGEIRRTSALAPTDWLSLAAAPTFAAMALFTGVSGDQPLGMLCGPAHGVSVLGGMAPMYLLMGAFHSTPWLRLIAARRRAPKFDRTPST